MEEEEPELEDLELTEDAEGAAGAAGAQKAQKKAWSRSHNLPPCLSHRSHGECRDGCRACCGVRPRVIHDFIKRHVDLWDAKLELDNDGPPVRGELVRMKLARRYVLDAGRKGDNVFEGKVLEVVDNCRVRVYIRQLAYPRTVHEFHTLPPTAVARHTRRISTEMIKALARRIGEDGFYLKTAYRIGIYRNRHRQRRDAEKKKKKKKKAKKAKTRDPKITAPAAAAS